MLKRFLKLSACTLLVISVMLSIISCSPAPSKETFKDAQKDAVNDLLSSLDTVSVSKIDPSDYSSNMSLSINASYEILAILAATTGMDMSWINTLSLDINNSVKNNIVSTNVILKNSGKEIITAETIADLNTDNLYVAIPVLASQYLNIGTNVLTGNMNSSASMYSALSMGMPDTAIIKKLVGKYYTIVVDAFETVEIDKKGKVTIGDISQDCIVYTATLSRNEIYDLIIKLLETTKTDSDVKDLIVNLATNYYVNMGVNSMTDDAYNEVVDEIDYAIEQIKLVKEYEENPGETALVWTSYITKKNEILANSVKLVSGSEDDVTIFWGNLESKNNIAIEMWAKQGEQSIIEMAGALEKNNALISGTYELSAQGEKLLYVTVENFDTAQLEKGLIDGSVTISPAEGMADFLPAMGNLMLSSVALKLDIKQTENAAKIIVSILNNNVSLLAVTLEGTVGKGVAASIPTNVTSDIQTWGLGLDASALMNKISESGIPAEVITALIESFSSAGQRDEAYYEDYYRGYEQGYSAGCLDGLLGTLYNDYKSGSEGFKDGYADGYADGWNFIQESVEE